jgi:hypothetical protein
LAQARAAAGDGGTRLFEDVPALKLEQVESLAATSVTHVTYRVLP